MGYLITILPDYASIVHKKQKIGLQIRFIAPIRSSNRNISSTAKKPDHKRKALHGQAELDSHSYTTVADHNCTIFHHTER